MFNDAPKVLLEKIEQVVRLIRSKGVGVYFVTQNPIDIPDTVLGQLGNRVQHALRALTPRDQKAVKVAATTMRENPELNIETVITELGVGEALVSTLDENGRPNITQRVFMIPPPSRLGPASEDEQKQLIRQSVVAGVYEQTVDAESAYEKLQARATETAKAAEEAQKEDEGGFFGSIFGSDDDKKKKSSSRNDSLLESAAKSMIRAASSNIGREITRGSLGSLFGCKRR